MAQAQFTITRFTLDFLKAEAGAGFLLAATTVIAGLWANSTWAAAYFGLIHASLALPFGATCDVSEAVREGLMAIFFFLVGLEIKYEVVRGQLSDRQKLALPVIAALGGMVVPALVYTAVNLSGGDLRGWSIPTATDIAFALAVLAMVGKGLPSSLRVFLLTLAIVDDLGAIVIIGVFYNSAFQVAYLIAVAALLAVMAGLGRVMKGGPLIAAYLLLFALIWAASLKAGLAPSLAAVAASFCVTLGDDETGPLKRLVHILHPYVAYLILPLFAFTAAGFSLGNMNGAMLGDRRLIGIALGLFLGKQIGVYGAASFAIRLGWARLPEGASRLQLYGVCLLCGIGFTMSLFMGALALPEGGELGQNAVKLGVILGSLLSACAGAIILSGLRSLRLKGE